MNKKLIMLAASLVASPLSFAAAESQKAVLVNETRYPFLFYLSVQEGPVYEVDLATGKIEGNSEKPIEFTYGDNQHLDTMKLEVKLGDTHGFKREEIPYYKNTCKVDANKFKKGKTKFIIRLSKLFKTVNLLHVKDELFIPQAIKCEQVKE